MEYDLYELSMEFGMAHEDIIRMYRNAKLADSDWTQLPDAPLSAEKKQEWAVYRQYLRDYTKQFEGLHHYPDVITFNPEP